MFHLQYVAFEFMNSIHFHYTGVKSKGYILNLRYFKSFNPSRIIKVISLEDFYSWKQLHIEQLFLMTQSHVVNWGKA